MAFQELLKKLISLDPNEEGFADEWRSLRDALVSINGIREDLPLKLLSGGYTGQDLFDWICRYITTHVDEVAVAYIGYYDRERDMVKVLSACGKGGAMAPFTYELIDGLCSRVLNEGKVVIHQSGVAESFPEEVFLKEMQVEGYMGIPLISREGDTLGLAILLSQRPIQNPGFLESLLEIISDRVSSELERLLIDEIVQQRDRLSTAQQEVYECIIQDKGLEASLTRIVEMIEQEYPEVMGSIVLYDAEAKVLRHGAATKLPFGYVKIVDGYPIGPQVGSCGTAIYRKEEVIVTDILNDPLWIPFIELANRYGLGACWSIPIILESGEVLGSFAMYLHEPGSPTEDHLNLLWRAASLTGLVIKYHYNQRNLEASEKQFRQLFERNHAIMFLVDPTTWKIPAANKAALSFYGYSMEELHQLYIWDINTFPKEKVIDLVASVKELNVSSFRAKHRLKSGEIRDVQINSGPVETPEGELLYSIIQDVTVQVRAQESLKELNLELEERVRQRTGALEASNADLRAFASVVSHELRGPLRAVNGFVSVLKKTLPDEIGSDHQDYLRQIEENAQEMNELVIGLLDLARYQIEDLNLTEFDLGPKVQWYALQLQLQHPERKVSIDIEPNLICYGDRRLIGVVISNLLKNAWLYTFSKDQAEINVYKETSGGKTVLCVENNGIGFRPDQADQIFEPFKRLDNGAGYPGIGIGLATVARIIYKHGGEIWAEGKSGAGAKFSFWLPPKKHQPIS